MRAPATPIVVSGLLVLASSLVPTPAMATSDGERLPRYVLQSTLVDVASAQDDDEDLDALDDLDDEGEGTGEGATGEGGVDELEGGEAATEADKEVKVGGEKVGEALGGATGFEFPTGFYISADLGGFLRFGGYGDSRDGGGCYRCVPKLYSNLQPWIGINVGYDIIKNFGIEATLGSGFISDAAPVGYYFNSTSGEVPPVGHTDSPENSAITMLNIALTGSWYFLDRLAIQGKGFIGGAVLSPDPYPARLNLVRGLTCDQGFWGAEVADPTCGFQFGSDFGLAFGVGLGLRYATLLTDVVLGFDVNAYGVISPNVATAHTGAVRITEGLYLPPPISFGFGLPFIPAVSFAPVIKYVF